MPDQAKVRIRPATQADHDAIWDIIAPVIRQGETYTLPPDMTKGDALRYWTSAEKETFVADDSGTPSGTYYLRPNQMGGGSHVANCGYVTSRGLYGRGIARAMCEHSLTHAHTRGFRAMQFNFVVSTNERAVLLWQSLGFDIAGRLRLAFRRPSGDYVDALVMFRTL